MENNTQMNARFKKKLDEYTELITGIYEGKGMSRMLAEEKAIKQVTANPPQSLMAFWKETLQEIK